MKKLLVFFLVAAMSCATVLGVSGCTNGEEFEVLTAEQWSEACASSMEAERYKVTYKDNALTASGLSYVMRDNLIEVVYNEDSGILKAHAELYNGVTGEEYMRIVGNSVVEYGSATVMDELKDDPLYAEAYTGEWTYQIIECGVSGDPADILFGRGLLGFAMPSYKRLLKKEYVTAGGTMTFSELFSQFTYDEASKTYKGEAVFQEEEITLTEVAFKSGKVYRLKFLMGNDFTEHGTPVQSMGEYTMEFDVPKIVIPSEILALSGGVEPEEPEEPEEPDDGNLTEEEKLQKELERLEQLMEEGIITREDYEKFKQLHGLA